MPHFPGSTWTQRTPAELGLSPTVLAALASAVGGNGFVCRHGYQAYSWGSVSAKDDWASAAKPVTGTMVMFAQHEELITDFDDLIEDIGAGGSAWNLITKDETMTWRHLLNMISGYACDENPGAAWAYNDYAVRLLSESIFDVIFDEGSPNAAALDSGRFGALGLQDGSLYSVRDGYGISTSVRDFARIGWFWMNRGNWNGVQLLPESYFDEHLAPFVPGDLPRTTTVSANDYLAIGTFGGEHDQSEFGPGIYGNAWWFNSFVGETANRAWPDAPPDLYVAQGSFGTENVIMIPSLGIVCASYGGDWGTFAPGDSGSEMNDLFALLASAAVGGMEQSAFRGRNDDGDEDGATWKAAENENFSVNAGVNFRLRMQVNKAT